MDRDSWFFTRWVPGLTITTCICNKITGQSENNKFLKYNIKYWLQCFLEIKSFFFRQCSSAQIFQLLFCQWNLKRKDISFLNGVISLVFLPLYIICRPTRFYFFLYHVTLFCKGPILYNWRGRLIYLKFCLASFMFKCMRITFTVQLMQNKIRLKYDGEVINTYWHKGYLGGNWGKRCAEQEAIKSLPAQNGCSQSNCQAPPTDWGPVYHWKTLWWEISSCLFWSL